MFLVFLLNSFQLQYVSFGIATMLCFACMLIVFPIKHFTCPANARAKLQMFQGAS